MFPGDVAGAVALSFAGLAVPRGAYRSVTVVRSGFRSVIGDRYPGRPGANRGVPRGQALRLHRSGTHNTQQVNLFPLDLPATGRLEFTPERLVRP